MAYNKVIYDGKTLIDLTADTVDAAHLLLGYTAHDASGTLITGTAEGGDGGNDGLEFETGIYEPTSDVARPTISFKSPHTEAPILILMSDVTNTADTTTNTNYSFMYYDDYKLWGATTPYSSSAYRYGGVYYTYRATSANQTSIAGLPFTYNSDQTGSSYTYAKYWATNTGFMPYSRSTSRYWRSGKTYKWIAVWRKQEES